MTAPAEDESGENRREVCWRIHCVRPPHEVFEALTDPEQQQRYWCERATATASGYRFEFIDGTVADCEIVGRRTGEWLILRYFQSRVEIRLEAAASGTDLTLTATDIPGPDWLEVYAGWINVLLPLKAWVDFGIDLRNHDPARTWRERFVDQ